MQLCCSYFVLKWEGSKIITPTQPLKPAFQSRSSAEISLFFYITALYPLITLFILKLQPERSGSYSCRSFWIFCSSFHSQFPPSWYSPPPAPLPYDNWHLSWVLFDQTVHRDQAALYNQPHHQPYTYGWWWRCAASVSREPRRPLLGRAVFYRPVHPSDWRPEIIQDYATFNTVS